MRAVSMVIPAMWVGLAACSFHGLDQAAAGDDADPADASAVIDGAAVAASDANSSAVDAIPGGDATTSPPDAGSDPVDAFVCAAEDTTSSCVAGGACTDGLDNDADGNFDCRDLGCTGICGFAVCCPDGSCADLVVFCT